MFYLFDVLFGMGALRGGPSREGPLGEGPLGEGPLGEGPLGLKKHEKEGGPLTAYCGVGPSLANVRQAGVLILRSCFFPYAGPLGEGPQGRGP